MRLRKQPLLFQLKLWLNCLKPDTPGKIFDIIEIVIKIYCLSNKFNFPNRIASGLTLVLFSFFQLMLNCTLQNLHLTVFTFNVCFRFDCAIRQKCTNSLTPK